MRRGKGIDADKLLTDLPQHCAFDEAQKYRILASLIQATARQAIACGVPAHVVTTDIRNIMWLGDDD